MQSTQATSTRLSEHKHTTVHVPLTATGLYNSHYIIQTICDCVKQTFKVPSLTNAPFIPLRAGIVGGTGEHSSQRPRQINVFHDPARETF